MINQLRRAAAFVRQHVSLVASSPDGQRLVRGTLRAARAVAVDASLVALLAGVVAFAATRPTGAAPKAWYYAGGYGGGGSCFWDIEVGLPRYKAHGVMQTICGFIDCRGSGRGCCDNGY